jgi:Reverse transcriptase (RNA-dependent DNA polymerase)
VWRHGRRTRKAGILEDEVVTVSERGTGQGSVISPLLANVYLHYAFDLWANRWRQREATGDMIVVRYADDSVPRTHRRERRCGTAREMRVGPSEPAVRGRLQTTASCGGKEPLW